MDKSNIIGDSLSHILEVEYPHINKVGYSYNDISIIPAEISDINSRGECNPYYHNSQLPIFASPMSTVVSLNNVKDFVNNKIIPIIPRTILLSERLNSLEADLWVAVSLEEFKYLFIDNSNSMYTHRAITYRVCIDIANGHMAQIYKMSIDAKIEAAKHNCTLYIMVGNIANPATYQWITDNAVYEYGGIRACAVDFVRLSIGSGAQCVTSSNTGVHYPIASLISKCNQIKQNTVKSYSNPCPKIIADGGIRNYSDVIKALALGADYVMIGTLFAGMFESASPLLTREDGNLQLWTNVITNEDAKRDAIATTILYKECYGMSTKRAQSLINPTKSKKTAEGKTSLLEVKYTLKQWTDNLTDYLKSAMSYCNDKTLYEFIGNPDIIINSYGTMNVVNK